MTWFATYADLLNKKWGDWLKKYICYGGYVLSKKDKDMHYISAKRIAELYGVSPRDCLMIDDYNREEKTRGLNVSDRIELYPRYDGNYKLP